MDDVDWKALYLQQIELHNLTLDELRVAQEAQGFCIACGEKLDALGEKLSEENVNRMLQQENK